MFTVRPNVFETNSSSEHCLTVEDGMRDIEEFPVPDDTGTIHIPLIRNADDLSETKDFVSLVQYLVLMATHGGGYEKLFSLKDYEIAMLYEVIELAYRMACIHGVDDVVLDPPTPNVGIDLYGSGYITLWGGCYTDLATMGDGITDAIERLSWYVRDNNLANTLVTQYADTKGNKNVKYAAAALAMRTHGYFQEC